jgi:hypothetical protein
MASQRRAAQYAGNKTRVQGVSIQQAIKATPGGVQRIIVSNANAAVQTLTVTDGSTDLIVLRVPAGSTIFVDLGVAFATAINVTPSHANIDALILWD